MGWYIEIYDGGGQLLSSENGATYEAVTDAAKACRLGDFGFVRFLAPIEAKPSQLQALEAIGAKSTG